MNEPRISLRLIGESRTYEPGQALAGEYFVEISDPREIKAVEVSVLWHTEGKGDEDMRVHHFVRTPNDNGGFVDMRQSQHFEAQLPHTPLSYDGMIVKIHWCVRLRVFLAKGREVVAEQAFNLGNIPRPRRLPADNSESIDENGAAPGNGEVASNVAQSSNGNGQPLDAVDRQVG